MRTRQARICLVLWVSAAGCGATSTPPRSVKDLAPQRVAASQSLAQLQQGAFDQAARSAEQLIKADPQNTYARLVRAITRYKQTMHQLSMDLRTLAFGAMRTGAINHRYMRSTLRQAEQDLGRVAEDLAAADHPDLALELCLACWEVDWNHNGRVDRADRLLFQIERDAQGRSIPEDDPRRKPTFRFDHGDVLWARAFVSFQRAALDLVLAYRWTEVDRLFTMVRSGDKPTITLRLERPELVQRARQRLLEGLDLADRTREAYLAETDDEREWVPGPRQKSHPLPLPVDDALYRTWKQLVRDLRQLVRGEEGLSVAAVAQLGDHQWDSPPTGFIDIGRMLSKPRDITVQVAQLQRLNLDRSADVEQLLQSILGDTYVKRMKPSPITGRLTRMKREVKRGEESLERKLRYLIWLN